MILAHGLGGSNDLPIPYTYALIGAAWALTFTFAVVVLAWKKPRFDAAKPGRPLPQWVTTVVDAPATRWTVAVAGLLLTAWVTVAAVFGPQDGDNALPGVFYVLLWVGLVALSLAIGPVWRAAVAGAHALPAAAAVAARSAADLPGAAGLLAGRRGPVRVRVARARQPGPRIARRGEGLAAGVRRR